MTSEEDLELSFDDITFGESGSNRTTDEKLIQVSHRKTKTVLRIRVRDIRDRIIFWG